MLVWLALAWVALQLVAQRVQPLLDRPNSSLSLSSTPLSLHLSTTSPALLALPSALLDRLPRIGAAAALVGMLAAQATLLVAGWKVVRALWRLTDGATGVVEAVRVVKRAPIDVATASPSSASSSDLLLRPLIPSLSSLPLLILALVVSQGLHEAGHALAAASESLPLLSLGLKLLLFLPTFYVAFPSSASSSPALTTDLRVAAAGAWTNVLLVAAAWGASEEGLGMGRTVLGAAGAVAEVEEGVVVLEATKNSPLSPYLLPGTLITHLDDLELDASSSPSGSTVDLWSNFLTSRASSDPYENLGWCLDAELFGTDATPGCCAALLEDRTAAKGTQGGRTAKEPELCFGAFSASSSSRPLQACLNPLPFLSTARSSASPPPARCVDSTSCASSSGTVCARIHEREQVVRLTVRRGDVEREGEEEKEVVLYQGERAALLRQITVTDRLPRWFFLTLSIELILERFYQSVPPCLFPFPC
ncbi:hypothetical protein JCM8097_001661 [Rhodosporidiobolus ruineniae]